MPEEETIATIDEVLKYNPNKTVKVYGHVTSVYSVSRKGFLGESIDVSFMLEGRPEERLFCFFQ